MKKKTSLILFFVIIAVIGGALWSVQHHTTNQEKATKDKSVVFEQVKANGSVGLEPGNEVPDFALPSLQGKQVKRSSLKGKRVILNFWATWCPPCQKEMPDMEKMYKKHKASSLEVIGINLRHTEKSTENVSRFIGKNNVTFPILLDEEGKVSKQFAAVSLPTSYLIDEEGIIQKKVIGPLSLEEMNSFAKY
ncbi:thiol:disulfide interchange protein [Fictibacillus macauensis ZFHKF-1]|uniref:Thiol:disulfide interchange protein n=1 Tax=Fictibacillus macauensis ZFHKF-1 TaxID=1196324 RepID=I8AJS2_9BACL|nr:TlpA family protein disulfide reductase [Fictibacillus macauensis]EIT85794.1 thiol:disulfide interchange protein [Fictibacillus macauensis ZFHKF-1]